MPLRSDKRIPIRARNNYQIAVNPKVIGVESKKNPLSASGQAPVASESVVALSVRVALRAVARQQASCSWAGSALRAEWDIDKSECREVRVCCFQD